MFCFGKRVKDLKRSKTEGAMPNGIAYDEEMDILYVVHNLGD